MSARIKDFFPSDTEYARQHIERKWSAYLDPSAYKVLMFILDRTLGWSKQSERITHRQFLQGIISEDGTVYHCGTTLSKSSLQRALKRLLEQGVVLRKGQVFSINFDWKPSGQNDHSNGQFEQSKDLKLTLQKMNKEKDKLLKDDPTVSTQCEDLIREIEASWTKACEQGYPSYTHALWSKRTKTSVVGTYAKFKAKDGFFKFMLWSIENWTCVQQSVFHWMSDRIPLLPAIGWWVKWQHEFLSAFNDAQARAANEAVPIMPKPRSRYREFRAERQHEDYDDPLPRRPNLIW